jgi:hypothetical protein
MITEEKKSSEEFSCAVNVANRALFKGSIFSMTTKIHPEVDVKDETDLIVINNVRQKIFLDERIFFSSGDQTQDVSGW